MKTANTSSHCVGKMGTLVSFSVYSCHIKVIVFVLTLNLNTGNNTDCVGVCNREKDQHT